MLTLSNIYYSYTHRNQRNDVLKGISCTFESGKFYAIQGPSGSGKSTLLSLLSLLDHPTSGTILFNGQDIATINPDDYRCNSVSMIFQQYNLLPFMTVLENAAYPAELRGEPRKEALNAAMRFLNRVGLDPCYYNRMPNLLSGGEQQRVAIARTLCAKSHVVLADEPTGSLDAENSHNIVKLLQTMAHQENRTIIMVTHDANMTAYADVKLDLCHGVLSPESLA